MKRISEKVALVAQICIALIFALTLILCMSGAVSQNDLQDNKITCVLFSVLIAVFAVLSAYLLYCAFSARANIKRVLLFFDAGGATRASAKVVNNIVKGCAEQVPEVKIRKVKLHIDEKQEVVATLYIGVSADAIGKAVNKLRALITDNFLKTLGLALGAVNFEIDKLDKKFTPDTSSLDAIVESDSESVAPVAESVSALPENEEIPEHEAATPEYQSNETNE